MAAKYEIELLGNPLLCLALQLNTIQTDLGNDTVIVGYKTKMGEFMWSLDEKIEI